MSIKELASKQQHGLSYLSWPVIDGDGLLTVVSVVVGVVIVGIILSIINVSVNTGSERLYCPLLISHISTEYSPGL